MEHCCSITSLQLGETLPGIAKDMDTMTFRVPLGVTAGITPFNFPAMIPLWVRDISISLSWWHYFELCYKYDTQHATLNPTLELKWKPYNIKSLVFLYVCLSQRHVPDFFNEPYKYELNYKLLYIFPLLMYDIKMWPWRDSAVYCG